MNAYKPKIVMITGATGGFGEAFTRKFSEFGAKLVLTSRHQEKLNALAKSCGTETHPIVVDLSNRNAIEQAFSALPKNFREIDLLINNAGGAFGLGPAWEANLDDWQKMIDINASALAILTRLALPNMVKRNHGHIINIGSVAGTYPYPGGHVYCAVKAFVKQFSLSLRADLIGTGVRVTNIEPGMVETDFSLNRFHGDKEKADKVYKGAHALEADDVADAVFWAATQPLRVNINSIELMPSTQGPGALAVHRDVN